MKIEIKADRTQFSENQSIVKLNISNGASEYSTFGLLSLDEVEALELNLTNVVQGLYEYRKEMEDRE